MSKESALFQLSKIDGIHSVKELKSELDTFPGVLSVSVNTKNNMLTVDFDNTGVKMEQLETRMKKLGYQIDQQKPEEHVMQVKK